VISAPLHINECPILIKKKILYKRKLRRNWHRLRTTHSKQLLNTATRELKELLADHNNTNFPSLLLNLSATAATNYSLWKVAKNAKHTITPSHPLKTPSGTWARTNSEKAKVFANHLTNVFKPHPAESSTAAEEVLTLQLEAPYQLEPPLPRFRITEVKTIIKNLKPYTSPGYDLITGKVLQELPPLAIKFLTQIYNASTLIGYFPAQWKVAKIILHLKPGKPPNETNSYRPISLLPILSKIYEKLLLYHLLPIIEHRGLIPNHQFGFRRCHSTIQQTHRLIHKINDALEAKQYCSAAFLDISQAFDKVWHPGLLHKLRQTLPLNYYLILKSYLHIRHFQVHIQDTYTNLLPIHAGVPQESVLGPLLYLLYTSDLPTSPDILTATFADDTAILATDSKPAIASQKLQNSLQDIHDWLIKWRLKVITSKSSHVTFTNRKETCPPVSIDNELIPQSEDVKYLGLHLDRRLTWRKHLFTKRKQLGITLSKIHWMMGRNSRLSISNKLLLYKAIIKPIWTYGLQLWGTASDSNIEILERFQSKVMRIITDAPWYVSNLVLRRDLHLLTVKEEVRWLISSLTVKTSTS
jgi:hypothetical protein